MRILLITAFIAVIWPATGVQAGITEDQAVKCILGEARGEGYASLLAHSEAIRARGHLGGVYGCRAKISASEWAYMRNKGIYEDAVRAWRASLNTNTVSKAQYWGSLIYDKKWIKTMDKAGYIRTATIGNTAFYYNPKEGKE